MRPSPSVLVLALLAAACAAPAPEPETSVHPGINEPYRGEVVVDEWIERFEAESREVYAHRGAIVEAVGLRPGDDVADVGAGTGLFTLPFARAVGFGTVYAVDVVPEFLALIAERAGDAGLDNVTPVLGTDRSIELPRFSVDVVFACDTYHHFEYPRSTLASIRDALRPGGRLVVVDFERVPGVSRDWVLEHVRAGRATVVDEIEAAGFALVRELDLPLEENWGLEFALR